MPLKTKVFEKITFRSKAESEDPFNIPLFVQGIPFFVNRGILAINNDKRFGRGNNG